MDKQITKTIIGEKQQEIRTVSLLQRAGVFAENSDYLLDGIKRVGIRTCITKGHRETY